MKALKFRPGYESPDISGEYLCRIEKEGVKMHVVLDFNKDFGFILFDKFRRSEITGWRLIQERK